MIGAMARTSKGEDLGRIEDLIIDHMGGCVVNLVVSGKDGKLVKVPFSTLSKSGETVLACKLPNRNWKVRLSSGGKK